MNDELKISNLLDLEYTIARPLFEKHEFCWEILPEIKDFIIDIVPMLSPDEYEFRDGNIAIAKSATVAPSAFIGENTIICPGAEVRHGAFIRNNAIVGSGATVGNSTELKNAILFDGAQAPHFNYVGDSVYGHKSHTGAGVITSNLKSDKTLVTVLYQGTKIETGIKKFGAIIGDFVEVGCNSVLNPGSVIGRNSMVYPLSNVRGYIPEDAIYKNRNEIIIKEKQ